MRKILFFLVLPLFFLLLTIKIIFAVNLSDCENDPSQNLSECISLFSNKVSELSSQKKTIASQISQFDTQIKITQLKITDAQNTIAQLEKEIGVLGFRIGYVTDSIGKLEKQVKQRIIATYQQSFISNLELVVASNDFSDLLLRLQYLKQVQENDKKILSSLQQTKANYANQKDEREAKQAAIEDQKTKLEELKIGLDKQKIEKQAFLEVTKNDEKRYQQILEKTKAEFEAIQGIIAGNGAETEVGHVNEGQKIATIIQGESCNSFGTHLHFTVSKNGISENPFNYLKSDVSSENNSGGDPFNPSGNWNWPINPTIKFNQGYGVTAAIRSHVVWYSFHNGLDISSSSSEIKAVKNGILYRGTYSGNGGCALRYVRVHHDDAGLDTFYLHVNYLL